MSELAVVTAKQLFREQGLALREGSQIREADGGAKLREVVLITEGWGSSGYYGGEMLERDVPRCFPVGTHMYLNHPTESEDQERPERDLNDLVGVIHETPRMAGIQAVAVAEVFAHWVPAIDAMAEAIGLSIRAFGISEEGDAAGKRGPIITALTEGISVDYVTHAGAGGKVGPLIESARQAPSPFEEELDSELRRNLVRAGSAVFGGAGVHVYLDDFDPDAQWVVFCVSSNYENEYYIRTSYTRSEEGITLSGDTEPVERTTSYVVIKQPYQETVPRKETEMTDEEKRRLSDLEESLRKMETRLGEADAKAEAAEKKATEEGERADRSEEAGRLREASTIVSAVVDAQEGLPKGARDRVVEAALRGELPLDGEGNLDEDVLKERASGKLRAEVEYLAGATGRGRVRGQGGSVSESGRNGEAPEEETEEKSDLQKHFEERGLSEAAAKRAAEGR